jgi:hypothetical protein
MLIPMDVEIRFNRAAFRHKVTKADILRAFETFIYEDPIEDADNKHLLLGFNTLGNLIVFEGYIPRPLGRISNVPLTKHVWVCTLKKIPYLNNHTPLLAAGLVV